MAVKTRVLSALLALSLIAASLQWSALPVAASYGGVLQFNEDGKFTVLQLADIQENKDVEPGTIQLITTAIARYSPDLVVLTGDNVKGLISSKSFESAVDQFLAPLLATNTRFAVTFGNHDDLGPWPNPGTREEQYAYYKSKGGNLFVDHDVPELNGTGSGTIPIYAYNQTSGTPAFQVFLMDSGAYINITLDLDGIRTSQIDYYLTTNPSVPALWFQHIPVPDFYNLLVQVPEGTANSFEGSHKPFKNYTWAMNPDLVDWKASGSTNIADIYKEAPGPTDLDTYQEAAYRSSAAYGSKTLYEAWLANGNMEGAFFGHNHKNSFVATTADGITLGCAKAATLEAYNDGDPGFRVFEIDESGTYTTISATRSSLSSYAPGDYSAVNSAVASTRVLYDGKLYFKANNINDPEYYDPASTTVGNGVFLPSDFADNAEALQVAVRAIEHNLDSRYQSTIDGFAGTILSKWQALTLKPADYSLVNTLLAKATQTEILAPSYYNLTHSGQLLPVEFFTAGTLDTWNFAKASVVLNLKIPAQISVDTLADTLNSAYEALRLQPEFEQVALVAALGSSAIINHSSFIISGLVPGLSSSDFESEFVHLYGNGRLAYDHGRESLGTGSKVFHINNLTEQVIHTYTILIFGDVNGDGNVDGTDAGKAVDYENYLFDWQGTDNNLFRHAADVNGDGAVDSIDAGILVDFENYKTIISQM